MAHLIELIIMHCLMVMLVGFFSWAYIKNILRTTNCGGKTIIELFVLGVSFGIDVFGLVIYILELISN